MASGVPSWSGLVARLHAEVLGEAPPAWITDPSRVPSPHPLALQIAFESIEVALSARRKRVDAGRAVLASAIAEAMYRDVKKPSGPTLDTLARLLVHDQARASREIVRVITFNADDLLERAANARGHAKAAPIVWPISRESAHIRRERGLGGRPPIPVYHVHGFLPGDPRAYRDAPDCLVFTDEQYWATVASPTSFPNRVLMQALHDSHCVFVGLSMTDVNLARWLGVRRHLFAEDKAHQPHDDATKRRRSFDDALRRHTFVRTAANDPEKARDAAFLSAWLGRRGVDTHELTGWGEPFDQLIRSVPWGLGG